MTDVNKMMPCKIFNANGKLVAVCETRKAYEAFIQRPSKPQPKPRHKTYKYFYQDGSDFYDSESGTVLWSGKKFVKKDSDTNGAIKARIEFQRKFPGYWPETGASLAVA